MKTEEIATPSNEGKRHIFFVCAENEKSDVEVAEQLKKHFIQRRLRVYHPRENEDINIKIANGIENAAVVLIFPSRSLETSKTGSKLLNYADQTRTPILNINRHENFQPKGWLGAILAPTKSCRNDFNEVMASLISMGIKTDTLVLDREEKNEPQPIPKYLFHGGTKLGNMSATYHYSEKDYPMEFEVFNKLNRKIYSYI